jgi:imidazolonepropionase-like amidohydrolase
MRGEKVEAVGTVGSVQIPAAAEVRDLKGKALMPGLADMHVHLNGGWDGESVDMLGYQRYLNALLYAGVTTVFDAGNTLPYIIQLRDEIAAGRLIGPRIYCAGPLLDGADPAWRPISYSVTSVDQIPGIVKELKQSRVDAIKAYAGLYHLDRAVAPCLVDEQRQ